MGPIRTAMVPITRDNVLGAVSLIFWSLLLLITLKYIGFVLYADDHGEGGVFALLGLLNGMKYLGAGLGERHAPSGGRAVIWRWADYARDLHSVGR